MGSRIGSIRNGTLLLRKEFDRLVEAVQHLQTVGNGHDFTAPVGRGAAIGGIDRQHQLGSGLDRPRDFVRMEAVDRDAAADVAQRLDAVGNAGPRLAGLATHVDHVGAVGNEVLRLGRRISASDSCGA